MQIVRNVHEGRRPEGAFGLLLLVVPGILALTRWSLMAPAIVLEGREVFAARRRSKELVQGNGPAVFLALLLMGLAVTLPPLIALFGPFGFTTQTLGTFVWSALTAPLTAHLYTVLYYRLADPDRPVVAPEVWRWRSVWDGA